jgi:RimJ/RimL family protein N-acetyltransferase
MQKTTILETGRLRIRPCRPSDIPGMLVGLNDWAIAQWLPGPPFPYTEADAYEFIRMSTATVPPSAYAVADRMSDQFLGTLGLAGSGVAELGYWLLPAQQGRGIMREAIAALLRQRHGALASIFATVDRGNAASIKLLEASGLSCVGEHVRETPNRQGNLVVLRYELQFPRAGGPNGAG